MPGILDANLCTEAFLYLCYSFLLIFNKFCDLSLLHWVRGGGGGWGAVRLENLLHLGSPTPCGGWGSAVRKMCCTGLPAPTQIVEGGPLERLVPKTYVTRNIHIHRLQNTETHVHKTIYGPLIITALYVMLLMLANPLLAQVGEGWALEISTFLGPK